MSSPAADIAAKASGPATVPAAAQAAPASPGASTAAAAPATSPPTLAVPAVTLPVRADLDHAPALADAALFPRPALLRPAVAFWTDIFAKYSENQSVVHAEDDLSKVYTVLDFSEQATTMNPVRFWHYRAEQESAARDRVETMLKHINALQATPDKLDPEERRIFAMFADSSDPKRFLREIGDTRVQRGLRERTDHALDTASGYLPRMEKIFAGYGLPTELTRLPLVESSFNVDAYSKDGAAGVWQFMPASARIYMRLDNIVDDRRDIWFSTDAAARHLRDDYDALRDWPLAVTAYNHGRGGLARGLITVQGNSLTDLIQHWHNANFGFASRNFYAEFLAATDVERAWRAQHPLDGSRGDVMHFDVVTTHDYLPYATLRKLAGLDEDTFRALNPEYRQEIVDGKLYVPPDQEIRVPAGATPQFLAAYAALPETERFAHQREYFTAYVVRRGDSLGKLARRFGVSSATILAANELKPHSLIRVGQTLKIPPHGGDPGTLVASAAGQKTPATRSAAAAVQYLLHRIVSGQTLGEIARRYKTTVKAIMDLNALTDVHRLKVGSMIKIPLSS